MIDWLTVAMFGPFHCLTIKPDEPVAFDVPNVRPGLALVRQRVAPKGWRDRYYLTDRAGHRLVTILAAPENVERNPRDYYTAQFDNSVLATGEWRELHRALIGAGSNHAAVLRVDIAADGWVNTDGTVGGGGDFLSVVQAANLGFGRYYGKGKWALYHEKSYMNGFDFGKKSNGKYMRCYYKKMEMIVKGHKPHISAAWDAATGIDTMADPREVGRLEVQLKGKELRRYFKGESDPEQLAATLHDPGKRAGLFHATTRTLFDFRSWSEDGRARSAFPLHVWDWSQCTTNGPERYQRDQRARKTTAHAAKVGLHYLHELYRITGDPELLQLKERTAAALGSEFIDYCRRKERQWDAIGDAVEYGTKRRPGGTDDVFTRSFWANLRRGVIADEKDRVLEFENGSSYIRDINVEDSDLISPDGR